VSALNSRVWTRRTCFFSSLDMWHLSTPFHLRAGVHQTGASPFREWPRFTTTPVRDREVRDREGSRDHFAQHRAVSLSHSHLQAAFRATVGIDFPCAIGQGSTHLQQRDLVFSRCLLGGLVRYEASSSNPSPSHTYLDNSVCRFLRYRVLSIFVGRREPIRFWRIRRIECGRQPWQWWQRSRRGNGCWRHERGGGRRWRDCTRR